tara:strand:- start:4641 stop:5801 length:1161 start_codon:yes stop_codon:yes gene_type:complete
MWNTIDRLHPIIQAFFKGTAEQLDWDNPLENTRAAGAAQRVPEEGPAQEYAELIIKRYLRDPHPQVKGSVGPDSIVYQKHHIIPKALAPRWEKKKWNIVRLTMREHFEAHVLLVEMFPGELKFRQALSFMSRRYRDQTGKLNWELIYESERISNEAASKLQSHLRKENWKNPIYARRQSAKRSAINRQNWKDSEFREARSKAIKNGREKHFYSDPKKVSRATAAQSEKTSGAAHWRHVPVNIYNHETGELVVENVNLSAYCKENGLVQGHMHNTLHADRRRPSSRRNRTHAKGFFARALDDKGEVIGLVCPAVPQRNHHNARRADIYRYADGHIVAKNVIISQFCRNNPFGIRFCQSALSRTANLNSQIGEQRRHHKGFYARYRKQ